MTQKLQLRVLVVWCLATCAPTVFADDAELEPGRLRHTASVARDSLRMVTSVESSRDGQFLYAAAWQAAAVNVFRRDSESGELVHLQEIRDRENLAGATALRLSPNGEYAVASAFSSQTAVLYGREPATGQLRQLAVARNERDGVTGLGFAIDAAFSADSRFVYVINATNTGSVTAFRIGDGGKLEFVEANEGRGNCFANVRGIVAHPDGTTLVIASSQGKSLVLLDRDADSGKTAIRQIIRDGSEGVRGLDGAMGVAISPDGRFVYTSAGRFRGDNAVGVYEFGEGGLLRLVQEMVNDGGDLQHFIGGNEIAVSPDGQHVYAVASRSNSLACFQRDLKTGKLRFLETIQDKDGHLRAVAGLALTPDGRFLYAAAEGSQTISVFRRATYADG